MTDGPTWVPEGVDITVPSAARMYDYVLGGAHNFAVDRQLADKAAVVAPVTTELVLSNRAFLRRAVLALMDSGIRQFLDLGSGIPTVGNVHEIARQVDPSSRVVYVDYDDVAVAHSQQVLAGDDLATVIEADMRDPEAVLGHSRTRGLLDFEQPIGLLMVTVMHYVTDDATAGDVIARYRDAVVPGSHLALTHITDDIRADEMAATAAIMSQSGDPVVNRSYDAIVGMFGDFELLEPGLVPTSQWRPDPANPPAADDPVPPIYAGIGVKRGR